MRLAADLASRDSSRLTALYVRKWSRAQFEEQVTAELGLVTAEESDHLQRRIEAAIKNKGKGLRSTPDTSGTSPVCSPNGAPWMGRPLPSYPSMPDMPIFALWAEMQR